MNAFKSFVAKAAAQAPQGGNLGSGGSSGLTVVALLGLAGYAGYNSMVTVQPGHAAVVYNRISGLNEINTLHEGLNFVIPWLERAVVFDVRTRPKAIETQSGSKGECLSMHLCSLTG
jgi:prohibitin 2